MFYLITSRKSINIIGRGFSNRVTRLFVTSNTCKLFWYISTSTGRQWRRVECITVHNDDNKDLDKSLRYSVGLDFYQPSVAPIEVALSIKLYSALGRKKTCFLPLLLVCSQLTETQKMRQQPERNLKIEETPWLADGNVRFGHDKKKRY